MKRTLIPSFVLFTAFTDCSIPSIQSNRGRRRHTIFLLILLRISIFSSASIIRPFFATRNRQQKSQNRIQGECEASQHDTCAIYVVVAFGQFIFSCEMLFFVCEPSLVHWGNQTECPTLWIWFNVITSPFMTAWHNILWANIFETEEKQHTHICRSDRNETTVRQDLVKRTLLLIVKKYVPGVSAQMSKKINVQNGMKKVGSCASTSSGSSSFVWKFHWMSSNAVITQQHTRTHSLSKF